MHGVTRQTNIYQFPNVIWRRGHIVFVWFLSRYWLYWPLAIRLRVVYDYLRWTDVGRILCGVGGSFSTANCSLLVSQYRWQGTPLTKVLMPLCWWPAPCGCAACSSRCTGWCRGWGCSPATASAPRSTGAPWPPCPPPLHHTQVGWDWTRECTPLIGHLSSAWSWSSSRSPPSGSWAITGRTEPGLLSCGSGRCR